MLKGNVTVSVLTHYIFLLNFIFVWFLPLFDGTLKWGYGSRGSNGTWIWSRLDSNPHLTILI